ncbi:alpha/beta fold hydrolase [Paenibacillus gansuensis]|uniref:Alpha/beta fold hydrolase n=1 Tax=Paenibacillus gansuensis TaxID=306542 RepID=A0ABW5PIP7_9BACL
MHTLLYMGKGNSKHEVICGGIVLSGTTSRFFAKLISIMLIISLMLLTACAANNKQKNGPKEYAADKTQNKMLTDKGNEDSNQAANQAYSDMELVRKLPGFQNGYKKVNGVTLHYVEGGKGDPLFLLPGWPQNWYAFHKIMPALAKKYHVYSIDYRGMGSSGKPEAGYDKKTMASDIYALAKKLRYRKINIAGHDIGSMVAYAYAAQYPQATNKLAMLDVPHPNENFLKLPILPPPGSYDVNNPDSPKFPWWFALNNVPELPEQLLQGEQSAIFQNWIFDYQIYDKAAMPQEDRAVYTSSYANPEAIRASNGWYKTLRQDVEDLKTYKKLSVPVLGIGGSKFGLEPFLRNYATDVKIAKLDKAGHWIAEEKPQETVRIFMEFFR